MILKNESILNVKGFNFKDCVTFQRTSLTQIGLIKGTVQREFRASIFSILEENSSCYSNFYVQNLKPQGQAFFRT